LNSSTINNGSSSIGLEKMIIPSILLHLAIIALVIAAPTLYIKRTSYPQIYMVSLVSALSEKPLGLGEERINKEIGKIESINPIKNLQKVVKVENKKIAVSEPEERIKTGHPGLPEQGAKELTDRDGDPIRYSLSSRNPVLRSTDPSFIENPKPHYPKSNQIEHF